MHNALWHKQNIDCENRCFCWKGFRKKIPYFLIVVLNVYGRHHAAMSLRGAVIILSLFAWCAYVSGGRAKQVNCEKYVFHPNCRGSQARKRFISMVDNDNTEPACPCANPQNLNNKAIGSLTNSKLLEALFANGFDVNTIYDAYMATSDRRRDYNVNRDRSGQRRKSIQDSSIDLGAPDMDEDY